MKCTKPDLAKNSRQWRSEHLHLHLLSRSGKIGSSTIPVTLPSSPLNPSLTSFLRDTCEQSAPRSKRPGLSPTATITALDFPAFTTDHQQKWLSPTPSTLTASSQNQQQQQFDQDFTLVVDSEIPHRTAPASRAQAISSTTPKIRRLPQARHLSINSGVPPLQSISSPSLGHYYSPVQHLTTSPALLQQQLAREKHLRHAARLQGLPPVPSFNHQPSVPRRNYSAPLQGTMSNAFDSMYLPETGFNASPYDLVDFDGLQSTFQNTNHGTISPSDLFVDDSIVYSAPPSSAFPNLSTPDSSFLDSPAMANSSLNTTPLEDGLLDGQLNFADLDSMPPLFPQNSLDEFASAMAEPSPYNSGFASVNSTPAQTRMIRQKSTGMERQKSSPGRPPSQPAHARKRSDACGISKAPRPRKQLAEIQVESEDDKETAKRKKNTAAARKSRQRKADTQEYLESENQRLRRIIFRHGLDPDEE